MMRALFCKAVVVAVSIVALHALTGAAQAKSCSDRLTTCQRYCEKSMPGSHGCLGKCDDYLQACRASGCWESKIAARECGLTRQ
jgi:hypothetical protein